MRSKLSPRWNCAATPFPHRLQSTTLSSSLDRSPNDKGPRPGRAPSSFRDLRRSVAPRLGLRLLRLALPQEAPEELSRPRTAGSRRPRHLVNEFHFPGQLVDRDLAPAEFDQLLL